MGEWTDRIIARVKDRLETECDAIGVDMVADIRESISVPVEIIEYENSVTHKVSYRIIRSSRGEPPRKEFGVLWESERHEVLSEGPQLNIINDAPYARRLENGDKEGNLAPRPFHAPALERWLPQIRQRAVDAITGKR